MRMNKIAPLMEFLIHDRHPVIALHPLASPATVTGNRVVSSTAN
jgi:hypothetical protein